MNDIIKKVTKETPKRKRIGTWDNGKYVESPKVDKFLLDVLKVCEKHGMSISHEDSHGGFEVVNFDEECVSWLWGASDKKK